MALSIGKVFGLLTLDDQFTSRLQVAADRMVKFGGDIDRIGRKVSEFGDKMTTAVTLPVLGAAAASLKFATDFETNMTRAVTLSGLTEDAAKRMRGEILELAPAVGRGPGELSKALLVVTSTGLRGGEAMEVLASAAKASAVGLGETDSVARAVTAAMNSYGKENLSASKATDILFRAVKAGGAEATELAGVLGRVTGVASQVGVSFEQVGTFIATFTRLGVNAAEATTSLGAVMSTLLKPTQEAEDALKMAGTSVDELRASVRERGLTQALLDLTAKFKGNDDALAAIIPNVRALRGVMGTAGAQAESFNKVLAEVSDTTDTLDKAFDRTTKTGAMKWDQFLARVEKVAIQIGDKIAPNFNKLLDAAMPILGLIEKMIAGFAALPEPVQTFTIALIGLGATLGPIMSWGGRLLSLFGQISGAFGLAGAGGGVGAGVGATGALVAFKAALASMVVPAAIAGIAYGLWKVYDAVIAANKAFNEGRLWEHITSRQETWASRLTHNMTGGALGYVAPPSTGGVVSPQVTLGRGTDVALGAAGAFIAPPTSPATVPVSGTPFADQLRDADEKIRKLASSVRNDLTNAIKSGAFGMDELKTMSGLSEIALKRFQDRVDKATESQKKHAAALKKFNEDMKEYHDMMSLSVASPLRELPGIMMEINMPTGGFASAHWVDWAAMQKESRDRALVDQFSGKLPGEVLEMKMPEGYLRGFWKEAFGTAAGFGAGLSSAIMGAIQGGGSVIGAAGSFIGQGLTGSLAKHLTGGLAPMLTGVMGGAVNAILPGLGSLLGPLAEKAFGMVAGLFDRNKGRDTVEAFAATFGGFDAMHEKLLTLGDAGEAFWIKLTQGTGRNDAGKAKSTIAEINAALAAQMRQQTEVASAVDKAVDAQSDLVSGLIDTTGVSLELGRAGPESIEKLVNALDRMIDKFEAILTKISEVAGALVGLGRIDVPSLQVEARREAVPHPSAGSEDIYDQGGGRGPQSQTVTVEFDGERLGRKTVPYIATELSIVGV